MMGSVRTAICRHPLTVFFAASVALGWLITLASARLASNPLILPLIAIPVSYVPAVVAWFVLRIAGTPEERGAWRRRLTRVRVGWIWYAFALVVLPLAHLVGVGIAVVGGGTLPWHPELLALLPIFLVTSFGEEIGWRGYALPVLQERMSPLAAALVLGVVWGMFHWVALAGNADVPLAYIAVGTLHLVATSVILTFVFNGSRESVPIVALVHAMDDTVAIGVAPLVGTGVPLLAFTLTAVAAWLAVLVLVGLTGTSLGRNGGTLGAAASV